MLDLKACLPKSMRNLMELRFVSVISIGHWLEPSCKCVRITARSSMCPPEFFMCLRSMTSAWQSFWMAVFFWSGYNINLT